MRNKTVLLIILCFSLIACNQTLKKSINQENKLPGDQSLLSSVHELANIAAYDKGAFKYSVEDYFKKPNKSDFQFSPNGKYFSFREKDDNGKKHIYVQNLKTDNVVKAISEGNDLIIGYYWANNNRLLYMQDEGGNENYQLFAADLDGKNQSELTPYDNVQVEIINSLKDQEESIIILMNKDNEEVFEPYKININDGTLDKLYENKDIDNPIKSYDFDKDGNLRAYTQQQNGVDYILYYRINDNFEKIIKTTWKDTFSIIDFNYASNNPNDAYVISNITNNTDEIILYDFAKNQEIRTLFSNPNYDAGGMESSRAHDYEIDYFHYSGVKAEIIPVSSSFKKLHAKFKKQFKGEAFSIANRTYKEDKYLIYTYSDKLYGKYFSYDVNTDTFKEIINLMPQLHSQDMATMKPIKFKSRDGLTLHGYLTIPNSKNKNKMPLIVNPHGGPYGVRDTWDFNSETQLFASRGYATLQINYRGSGGFGKSFLLAGNKQIGRKMLDDLEDGVAYVKSLKIIDNNKIAIYGGSYGGLATLGSLVKTPDLYVCGVDYVGVSNLFTFFDSFPPYWKPYLGQVYEQWYNPDDVKDQEIMKLISPALNVDKITKPLFVIQGANDPRVNINESDQIVKNLRTRGFGVPYLVKYNEGHGFAHEDNRILLYKTMMGFFAKHLK